MNHATIADIAQEPRGIDLAPPLMSPASLFGFIMRILIVAGIAVALVSVSAAADAQDLGALEGFGGVSHAGAGTATSAGATLRLRVIPHLHAIGEMGRLGSVMPAASDTPWSRAGVRASALYAEGGLRVIALPRSSVTPYAEGTAGLAHLSIGPDRLGGLGSGLASAALSVVGSTGPIVGAGGGLLVNAGPMVFDVGFRHKQILPLSPVGLALGMGRTLQSQQVRVGVGVRF